METSHRLWNFESEDSNPQADQHRNDADLHYAISTDSRDTPLGANLDDNDFSAFEYEALHKLVNLPTPGNGEVIIAVQCFTIRNSVLNKNLTQEFIIDNVSLNFYSGVAVVGVVKDVGDGVTSELIGTRVSAVIKTVEKNKRYARVKSDLIVPVPNGLDSSEVAAASYTYFVAFQSLMHGINSTKHRYSKTYLEGKSILIIDGTSAFGQAMIQISRLQGVSNLYATAEETNHMYLKSLGAKALSNNPRKWPKFLNGTIDIIMVGSRLFQYTAAERVLRSSGGKVVYIGSPMTIDVLKYCSVDSWICLFEQLATQCALICSRKAELQASYYDLLESINNYPRQSKVRFI
jgi:NADPH:quinone reductase-like Zn-dependent oxidoreductase